MSLSCKLFGHNYTIITGTWTDPEWQQRHPGKTCLCLCCTKCAHERLKIIDKPTVIRKKR
jgi:hypothetical protein